MHKEQHKLLAKALRRHCPSLIYDDIYETCHTLRLVNTCKPGSTRIYDYKKASLGLDFGFFVVSNIVQDECVYLNSFLCLSQPYIKTERKKIIITPELDKKLKDFGGEYSIANGYNLQFKNGYTCSGNIRHRDNTCWLKKGE